MALITLAEFKQYLQISDSTYDSSYTVFVDAVSADVEKIANQYFALQYTVETSQGSPYLTSTVEQYDVFEGMIVTGAGIPDNTIIRDISLYQATMNKYATASGGITATYNPVPEQIKPVIAQMVMYKIANSIATKNGEVADVESKRIGPLSLSFGQGSKLDRRYGYPKNLVDSIKSVKRASIDIGDMRILNDDITGRF